MNAGEEKVQKGELMEMLFGQDFGYILINTMSCL